MVFFDVSSFAVEARYDMKTVADLVRARTASFWRDVLAGRVPRARREVSVRGRRRSCVG